MEDADEIKPSTGQEDAFRQAFAAVSSLKEAGNDALKSKDLPLAIEHYEAGVNLWEEALAAAPQSKPLHQND
jgi:hypothetical protein